MLPKELKDYLGTFFQNKKADFGYELYMIDSLVFKLLHQFELYSHHIFNSGVKL